MIQDDLTKQTKYKVQSLRDAEQNRIGFQYPQLEVGGDVMRRFLE